MAKTWNDMVDEAKAQTTAVTPVEAQQKLQNDPDALLIEVRDKDVVPEGQRTPETLMISLGFLPFRRTWKWPNPCVSPFWQTVPVRSW